MEKIKINMLSHGYYKRFLCLDNKKQESFDNNLLKHSMRKNDIIIVSVNSDLYNIPMPLLPKLICSDLTILNNNVSNFNYYNFRNADMQEQWFKNNNDNKIFDNIALKLDYSELTKILSNGTGIKAFIISDEDIENLSDNTNEYTDIINAAFIFKNLNFRSSIQKPAFILEYREIGETNSQFKSYDNILKKFYKASFIY